jgi:urease accessory protein
VSGDAPPKDRPNASDAEAALYRLMSWLSPTFLGAPEGYSCGLKAAVRNGEITDYADARRWLEGVLGAGIARTDAVLLTQAARANSASAAEELAALATALCGTAEHRRETTYRGRAFYEAACDAWPCRRLELLASVPADALPYPIAVGVTSAGHGIRLHSARLAYLQTYSATLVAATVRCVPLAEIDGPRLVADLEPIVREVAEVSGRLPIEGIGGFTQLADIAAMREESFDSPALEA